MFTDESKFCLDHHDGRERVWRQRNEVLRIVTEHNQFGGGSVLVWAGISFDGRTDLYVMMNGSVNGLRYRYEILAPFVVTYAVGQEFILMDDNATAHRARIVTAYLEDHGIERMDWPAKSSDMDPIERAWDMLHRRVSAHPGQLSTTQELADALREAWGQIPQNDIKTLIDSFPTRVRGVIQANGGHTRY